MVASHSTGRLCRSVRYTDRRGVGPPSYIPVMPAASKHPLPEPAGLSWVGPAIDDHGTLMALPADLRALLESRNGFIAHQGGLHVRGACREPRWHSLGYWWRADDALHRLFTAVHETDVPFAQDAFGNQFLLRDGEVHRLVAREGMLERLGMGLGGFLHAAERDAEGFLSLLPLSRFVADGAQLGPGELLDIRVDRIPRVIPIADLIGAHARSATLANRAAYGELGADASD
jgi:hypothetical protein